MYMKPRNIHLREDQWTALQKLAKDGSVAELIRRAVDELLQTSGASTKEPEVAKLAAFVRGLSQSDRRALDDAISQKSKGR